MASAPWIIVFGFATVWWQRVPGQLVAVWLVVIGIAAAGRSLATDPANPSKTFERIADWVVALPT